MRKEAPTFIPVFTFHLNVSPERLESSARMCHNKKNVTVAAAKYANSVAIYRRIERNLLS